MSASKTTTYSRSTHVTAVASGAVQTYKDVKPQVVEDVIPDDIPEIEFLSKARDEKAITPLLPLAPLWDWQRNKAMLSIEPRFEALVKTIREKESGDADKKGSDLAVGQITKILDGLYSLAKDSKDCNIIDQFDDKCDDAFTEATKVVNENEFITNTADNFEEKRKPTNAQLTVWQSEDTTMQKAVVKWSSDAADSSMGGSDPLTVKDTHTTVDDYGAKPDATVFAGTMVVFYMEFKGASLFTTRAGVTRIPKAMSGQVIRYGLNFFQAQPLAHKCVQVLVTLDHVVFYVIRRSISPNDVREVKITKPMPLRAAGGSAGEGSILLHRLLTTPPDELYKQFITNLPRRFHESCKPLNADDLRCGWGGQAAVFAYNGPIPGTEDATKDEAADADGDGETKLEAGGDGETKLEAGGDGETKLEAPEYVVKVFFNREDFAREKAMVRKLRDLQKTCSIAEYVGKVNPTEWILFVKYAGVPLKSDPSKEPIEAKAAIKALARLVPTVQAIHEKTERSHCDLRPSNLMWNGTDLTIIDFGASRVLNDRHTLADGDIIGTISFASDSVLNQIKSSKPKKAIKIEWEASDDLVSLVRVAEALAFRGNMPWRADLRDHVVATLDVYTKRRTPPGLMRLAYDAAIESNYDNVAKFLSKYAEEAF